MVTAAQTPPCASKGCTADARAPEISGWRVADLNTLAEAAFETALAHAVEHAPWVARRTAVSRPFRDVEHLLQAMRDTIHRAAAEEQITLLRGHPELAGAEAREGRMTLNSTNEQERLGLNRLNPATFRRLQELNRHYRLRFGFPLVIALRLHADLESVLREAESRLAHEPGDERTRALQQVCEVMTGRVRRLVVADGPQTPSSLAPTHPPLHASARNT